MRCEKGAPEQEESRYLSITVSMFSILLNISVWVQVLLEKEKSKKAKQDALKKAKMATMLKSLRPIEAAPPSPRIPIAGFRQNPETLVPTP